MCHHGSLLACLVSVGAITEFPRKDGMPKRCGEKKREDQKRENCMNQRKQNLSNPRVLDSPQMLINNSDPEPFR